MDRIPVQPFLAVLIGTGIGALMCVAGQKHLNQLAKYECLKQSDTHRIITMRSWVGDATHCVHIRYLAN